MCANINKDAMERELKIQGKDRRVLYYTLRLCYVIYIPLANQWNVR